MNRRSFVRWLSLAPVAAPAALAAAATPALAPIAYEPLTEAVRTRLTVGGESAAAYLDLMPDGTSRLTFDSRTLIIPNLKITEDRIVSGAPPRNPGPGPHLRG